jgi:hypothetical protein
LTMSTASTTAEAALATVMTPSMQSVTTRSHGRSGRCVGARMGRVKAVRHPGLLIRVQVTLAFCPSSGRLAVLNTWPNRFFLKGIKTAVT